ncbi:MAG TPA: YbdD/YjiX family protein [Gemmatimonadales bacterium]|nr:YbdD/YjiX family protein [Gemmatimonadales bacterium]
MQDRRTGGQAVRRTVAWAGGLLRRIAGMPDYPAFVEHLRRCHPDRLVPTEREFYEEYLRARYADGPTRCC